MTAPDALIGRSGGPRVDPGGHRAGHSGAERRVSALMFALWGPVVLAAGLAGTIVDRFENRRILIAARSSRRR